MGVLAASAVLLLSGMPGASAAEQPKPNTTPAEILLQVHGQQGEADPGQPLTVPDEYQALIDSGKPVEITVNPSIGEVVDVEVRSAASLLNDAGVTPHNCLNSRPCWTGFYTPDAYYGFVGTGTVSGWWTNRGNFNSNNREAKVCWTTAGYPANMFCSMRLNKYTILNFTDRTGIGTQVTLY